jgi:hypothetical protein
MSVALRQALCYYLYKENIPCSIMAKVLGISRRLTYMHIYRVRDLLEVNDSVINFALDETKNHSITIRPCTIDGGIITRHVGYKMIIDNVVY